MEQHRVWIGGLPWHVNENLLLQQVMRGVEAATPEVKGSTRGPAQLLFCDSH